MNTNASSSVGVPYIPVVPGVSSFDGAKTRIASADLMKRGARATTAGAPMAQIQYALGFAVALPSFANSEQGYRDALAALGVKPRAIDAAVQKIVDAL